MTENITEANFRGTDRETGGIHKATMRLGLTSGVALGLVSFGFCHGLAWTERERVSWADDMRNLDATIDAESRDAEEPVFFYAVTLDIITDDLDSHAVLLPSSLEMLESLKGAVEDLYSAVKEVNIQREARRWYSWPLPASPPKGKSLYPPLRYDMYAGFAHSLIVAAALSCRTPLSDPRTIKARLFLRYVTLNIHEWRRGVPDVPPPRDYDANYVEKTIGNLRRLLDEADVEEAIGNLRRLLDEADERDRHHKARVHPAPRYDPTE